MEMRRLTAILAGLAGLLLFVAMGCDSKPPEGDASASPAAPAASPAAPAAGAPGAPAPAAGAPGAPAAPPGPATK